MLSCFSCVSWFPPDCCGSDGLRALEFGDVDFLAAHDYGELRERPRWRALQDLARARVEPAVVAGALDLAAAGLVENGAREVRAFLFERAPFAGLEVHENIRGRGAGEHEGARAAGRHVAQPADAVLADDPVRGSILSFTATNAVPR